MFSYLEYGPFPSRTPRDLPGFALRLPCVVSATAALLFQAPETCPRTLASRCGLSRRVGSRGTLLPGEHFLSHHGLKDRSASQ